MSKKYYKSKNNIGLADVVIGDLGYLQDGKPDASASALVYQATIGRPCSVELVLEEREITDPEHGITHPIKVLSGSLIVQPCKNVLNTDNFITVDETLDLMLGANDAADFVQTTKMEIGCDTASVYIGRAELISGDDCTISTGADGLIGDLTEYRLPKTTVVQYPDGKVARFMRGFAGFIFDFDFDTTMVSAEDLIRYLSASFEVEMEEQVR